MPLKKLKKSLKGEFYTDKFMQTIYATDASIYREMPLAVAFPKSKDDLKWWGYNQRHIIEILNSETIETL